MSATVSRVSASNGSPCPSLSVKSTTKPNIRTSSTSPRPTSDLTRLRWPSPHRLYYPQDLCGFMITPATGSPARGPPNFQAGPPGAAPAMVSQRFPVASRPKGGAAVEPSSHDPVRWSTAPGTIEEPGIPGAGRASYRWLTSRCFAPGNPKRGAGEVAEPTSSRGPGAPGSTGVRTPVEPGAPGPRDDVGSATSPAPLLGFPGAKHRLVNQR